jgi:hypothetical protein
MYDQFDRLNFEQDLGKPGFRQAKRFHGPAVICTNIACRRSRRERINPPRLLVPSPFAPKRKGKRSGLRRSVVRSEPDRIYACCRANGFL